MGLFRSSCARLLSQRLLLWNMLPRAWHMIDPVHPRTVVSLAGGKVVILIYQLMPIRCLFWLNSRMALRRVVLRPLMYWMQQVLALLTHDGFLFQPWKHFTYVHLPFEGAWSRV